MSLHVKFERKGGKNKSLEEIWEKLILKCDPDETSTNRDIDLNKSMEKKKNT